MKNNGKISKMI